MQCTDLERGRLLTDERFYRENCFDYHNQESDFVKLGEALLNICKIIEKESENKVE